MKKYQIKQNDIVIAEDEQEIIQELFNNLTGKNFDDPIKFQAFLDNNKDMLMDSFLTLVNPKGTTIEECKLGSKFNWTINRETILKKSDHELNNNHSYLPYTEEYYI